MTGLTTSEKWRALEDHMIELERIQIRIRRDIADLKPNSPVDWDALEDRMRETARKQIKNRYDIDRLAEMVKNG